jgi:hypothetical protein
MWVARTYIYRDEKVCNIISLSRIEDISVKNWHIYMSWLWILCWFWFIESFMVSNEWHFSWLSWNLIFVSNLMVDWLPYFLTFFLTIAIPRGAFAPKNVLPAAIFVLLVLLSDIFPPSLTCTQCSKFDCCALFNAKIARKHIIHLNFVD